MLAALLIALPVAARADLPRVVSINLCSDLFALMLAAPGQILSLSPLSLDPLSSPLADAAAAYPINGGRAEEVVALQPDVVLAAEFSDPATVSMLRGAGLTVVQLPGARRLDRIPELLRMAGRAMDRADRAEAMAKDAEARLAAMTPPGPDAPVAAFFYPNGYSLGTGTLAHDIVTAAGLQNLSGLLGRSGGGVLPVEALLVHAPDYLVTAPHYPGHSRSEALTAHPALSRWAETGRILQSTPNWACGTPLSLDAVDALRAAVAD